MVGQSCYSLSYCKSQAASGRRPEEELAGPRWHFWDRPATRPGSAGPVLPSFSLQLPLPPSGALRPCLPLLTASPSEPPSSLSSNFTLTPFAFFQCGRVSCELKMKEIEFKKSSVAIPSWMCLISSNLILKNHSKAAILNLGWLQLRDIWKYPEIFFFLSQLWVGATGI